MSKKIVVSAGLLAKSQVAAYTRKDGTMVQAHDNGRQAAAPEPVNHKVLAKLKASHHMDARALKSSLASSLSSGDTEGHDGKPMTYGDVKAHINTMRTQLGSKPEHAEHLKHAQYALNQSFGLNHAPVSEKHAKLIGAALSGKTRMDDDGMVQHASSGRQAAAPKPAAHSKATLGVLAGQHEAEAARHDKLASKKGVGHPDYDHHVDASSMHAKLQYHAEKAGAAADGSGERASHLAEHARIKAKVAAVEARLSNQSKPMPDHVQKMVSDVAQSSAKPEHKKAAIDAIVAQHAGGAAAPKPTLGGRPAPAPGDVGHEEHQKYGVYFKKGDKVKDGSGKVHEVMSHRGPEVQTYNGGSFHPTKLSHADAPADGGGAKKVGVRKSVAKPAAAKTGSAAPAKSVNIGTEKWPFHAKSSEKLAAKRDDGSTHHIGGFEPPSTGKGDHIVHHDGKAFSFTGKSGKNMKTGEASYEYSHKDDAKGVESRAWVTHSGHLMND